MRVALCLSGQPRNAEKTVKIIYDYIIKPNNADVFIHSWYDENNLSFEKIDLDREGQKEFQKNLDKYLISVYKPKNYIFETQINFRDFDITIPDKMIDIYSTMNKKHFNTRNNIANHIKHQNISMFYSIYKCNQLKEEYANKNGFIYDCVIRLRFDAYPQIPLICNKFNMNYLYYQYMGHDEDLISDWFNMGNNQIMNIYSNTFTNLQFLNSYKFYEKSKRKGSKKWNDDEYIWGSEHLIRDNLQLYNIQTKPCNIGFKIIY